MDQQQLSVYLESLKREVALWEKYINLREDPWWPGIRRLPQYFASLTRLLGEPGLSPTQRRIVRRVLKYIVSPLDMLPEYIYGPTGYREDFYLIALAVEHWGKDLSKGVLPKHGLSASDPLLKKALERGKSDLNDDVLSHLRLLLEASAVSGDEIERETGRAAAAKKASYTMVFAGPGTGKTHRIEEELVRLLVEEKAPPEEIIATTFTNKAADELRVRLGQRLARTNQIKDPDSVLQRLSISTIHAFCYSLIEQFHHHILFLKGTFSPMEDMRRTLVLFRRGIGELKLKGIYDDWRQEQRQRKGYNPTDLFHFYRNVGEVYDFLSEEVMGGADEALRIRYLQILHEGAETVLERIIRTYPTYWRVIQGQGYLDQSMVLAYAEALLDDPQVLDCIRDRFRYLLVDEYQDTNPIQDRIFRKIVGDTGTLFAVGDDDQSIYAFRGADVRNATEFTDRYPQAKVEYLSQHWRSTKSLLSSTQQLISRNRTRRDKKLFTHNPLGEPPWRLEAPKDDLPERTAALIKGLRSSGLVKQWQEIALLFRAMDARVPKYKAALAEAEVPYSAGGDRRFLRQPFARAFVGVLKMVRGEESEIGPRKRAHKPFFEALGFTDRDEMLGFLRRWNRSLHKGEFDSLLDLFYTVLADTRAIGVPGVLPDLGRLSAIIADAEEELRSPDLAKRLDFFIQYVEAASGAIDGPPPPEEDAVQLMTIHKSKGLEFPVVVIAEVMRDRIPADFPENPHSRLRRELAGLGSGLDPIEEERRILYVGMTRAEKLVILATTKDQPSPFLKEFRTQLAPRALTAQSVSKIAKHQRKHRPPTPLHASHSHLYNYHFCPKRYLLESRYGFAGRAIAPLRAGVSLHRALEILHRLHRDGERITPGRRRRIMERSWVAPGSTKKALKEFEQLFGVFECYARSLEGPSKTRIIDLERPFYVVEKAGVFTGKIDLLRRRSGDLEIVEFKFHKNPMMPDYARKQLEHYRLAFPEEDPKLVVHFLREGKEERYRPRPSAEVREEIADVFERIRRKRFEATPADRRCRTCPVRFACSDSAAPRATPQKADE